MFVGHGGDVAGGIDTGQVGAAVGVDEDFADATGLQLLAEGLAVGGEADLHEDAVQRKLALLARVAMAGTQGGDFLAVAHHFGGLHGGQNVHVGQAADFLLQHLVGLERVEELEDGDARADAGQVDGCLDA